jgi:hypothetical protein
MLCDVELEEHGSGNEVSRRWELRLCRDAQMHNFGGEWAPTFLQIYSFYRGTEHQSRKNFDMCTLR